MKIKMPAKINLYLRILNKRPDGYHNLHTLMQTVSLYDVISVEIHNFNKIIVECNDPRIPSDKNNIAYKAAELFLNKYASGTAGGVKIYIDKKIPHEAGLAGGSADAAGVLILLNHLHEFPFTIAELAEIGAGIGSDVPFCVYSGTALCEGRGERVTRMPSVSGDCYILIVKPDTGLSTKEIFKIYRQCPSHILDTLKINANDLEAAAVSLMPCIGEIKNSMHEHGAELAGMSGSGSAVFGVFKNKVQVNQSFEFFKKKYNFVFLARPVDSWEIQI